MQIGILRHAIAEDEAPGGHDFDRRLTRAGRLELSSHLDLLQSYGWAPSVILHSPYVRTTQTAHAVAERFPEVRLLPSAEILHGDVPNILRLCVGHPSPLIVGHEPTVGCLVAHLLGAPDGATHMERAAFALLDIDRLPPTRPAYLRLFLPPRPGFVGEPA